MYMKHLPTGHMVEVMNLEALYDPFMEKITGRFHYGEEMQEPEPFEKSGLVFLSGEPLPTCWTDPHYRDHELRRSA